MSTNGWQESQEALQDSDESVSHGKASVSSQGVLKTEEVRVHHERISAYGDEIPIELRELQQAKVEGSLQGNHLRKSSF
jgi:hypothetical protein